VRRFYLYHCASTALQLEDLPEKKLPIETQDARVKDKDYKKVEPVLTLVWMVDDSLQFKENFAAYTTAPETTIDFVHDVNLWAKKDLSELMQKREIVLETLENRHKDLHFLQQNRLIFMFQHNIVNDNKFTKYRKWFEFAEKTRNKKNQAADFTPFKKEDIFKDIMRIILKKSLDLSDIDYIETEDEHITLVNRYREGIREDAFAEGMEKGMEKGIEKGNEKGIEIGETKKTIKGIEKALLRGKLSVEEIAEDFEISVEFVIEIQSKMK
jgi:hypothetical protein